MHRVAKTSRKVGAGWSQPFNSIVAASLRDIIAWNSNLKLEFRSNHQIAQTVFGNKPNLGSPMMLINYSIESAALFPRWDENQNVFFFFFKKKEKETPFQPMDVSGCFIWVERRLASYSICTDAPSRLQGNEVDLFVHYSAGGMGII